MIERLGARIALLSFAAAILAGLAAGNSEVTVLTRALVAMVLALLLGQAVGWACKSVVREHLQQIKQRLDREHLAALEAHEAAARAPANKAA
jgi:hypothetical protein